MLIIKSLAYLLALLRYISLSTIGSPISTDISILTKRGLEVTNRKEIMLVNSKTGSNKDIAAVSDNNKK